MVEDCCAICKIKHPAAPETGLDGLVESELRHCACTQVPSYVDDDAYLNLWVNVLKAIGHFLTAPKEVLWASRFLNACFLWAHQRASLGDTDAIQAPRSRRSRLGKGSQRILSAKLHQRHWHQPLYIVTCVCNHRRIKSGHSLRLRYGLRKLRVA